MCSLLVFSVSSVSSVSSVVIFRWETIAPDSERGDDEHSRAAVCGDRGGPARGGSGRGGLAAVARAAAERDLAGDRPPQGLAGGGSEAALAGEGRRLRLFDPRRGERPL